MEAPVEVNSLEAFMEAPLEVNSLVASTKISVEAYFHGMAV